MKPIILLCLSLFVFVSTAAPSGIAIDLVASQTITAGTNVEVKLSVKPAGEAMVLKALSGLKIKKDSTSVDLTCTIADAGIACAADTATTVPCTATLSVAGTYSLAGTVSLTATESDGTAIGTPATPTLGETTATVNAAGNSGTGGSSNGGSDTNNGSKFMEISFLLLLFGFLF